MKRLSLLFTVLICSLYGFAQILSLKQVQKVAQTWFQQRLPSDFPEFSIKETLPVINEGDTLFYAVNFYPKGFVMISASKKLHPIPAYSFESWYTSENQPENAKAWIEQYIHQAVYAHRTSSIPNQEAARQWERLLDLEQGSKIKFSGKSVEPLTCADWNQDWPYNEMCPVDPAGPGGHCYAGCVSTAIGLIMYYYRWPDTGVGYYSYTQSPYGLLEADFGNTHYAWEKMTNSINESDSAIAQLLYHIGVSCDLVYGPYGSGMYNHKAANAFRTHFKYSPETQYVYRDSTTMDWDSLLTTHLDRKMPLYYAGWSVPDINGHAFVCDGYQGTGYYHFNFGWGGSFNGYYYTNNLTPGGSNFNLAQEIIINCHPDTVDYIYPNPSNEPENLTFRMGSIDDGSEPRYPHPVMSKQWLISPQNQIDSISSITINFHRFDLDPGQAFLYIYDGPTSNDSLLGSFSGNVLPPSLTSSSNQVYIEFLSPPQSSHDGFFATYSSTQPIWCSGTTTYTEPYGTISDGSGKFWYRNRSICLYKIIPPNAQQVAIYFTKFLTEADHDKVKIFDYSSGQLLAEYSGHYDPNSPPPPVLSPSGKMYITFNSNNTIRDDGWEGYYESYFVGQKDELEHHVRIFPNPAQNIIWIELLAELHPTRLTILNAIGQIVSELILTNNEQPIEISVKNLQNGFYILNIQCDDQQFTGKILKY